MSPRHIPCSLVPAFVCLLAASPARAGGDPVVVDAGASDPAWLVAARVSIDEGIDAFYRAEFGAAVDDLVEAMKTLVGGFEEHPVDGGLLERGAVFLVLSLHAQGRDDEALEVATGLAEFSGPPWGTDLDLAPDAAQFLDEIASRVPHPKKGTVSLTVTGESCDVIVDGEVIGQGSLSADLAAGVHWMQACCEQGCGDHHRVEVVEAAAVEVVLDEGGSPAGPGPLETPPPAEPADKTLLVDVEVQPKPWFGDGWNLALEGAGVVLLGVGAGLIGGSLGTERKAFTRPGLGYADLEQKAFDMEVAGWVLLGTGAVALTIGVIRMSRTGGER